MLSRVPVIMYAVALWDMYGSDLTGWEVWTVQLDHAMKEGFTAVALLI